jgi:tetratricopeptide (TPR) repeat protein
MRHLPAGLLIYMVDVDLPDDEIKWASARYRGGAGAGAAAFFDVPYNEAATYDRSPTAAEDQAYRLPNILRRGGASGEAAYFGASVSRVGGVPACALRAQGATGGQVPAWAGLLQISGKRAAWDFTSARYREHAGYCGETSDPQTRATISDAEVGLSAALTATSRKARCASVAMCKSADLAPGEQAFAAYVRAIDLFPANRVAWDALAALSSNRKLDDDQQKKLIELVRTKLLHAWPDYALEVRLKMLKGRGSAERAAGVKQAAQMLRDRPDLVARLHFADADRLRADKRKAEALEEYLAALRASPQSGQVALAAMEQIDRMLHDAGDVRKLADLYRGVFEALPKPATNRRARTTAFYRIGEKYAEVLDELKETTPAAAVRSRLSGVVSAN